MLSFLFFSLHLNFNKLILQYEYNKKKVNLKERKYNMYPPKAFQKAKKTILNN